MWPSLFDDDETKASFDRFRRQASTTSDWHIGRGLSMGLSADERKDRPRTKAVSNTKSVAETAKFNALVRRIFGRGCG